MFCRFNESSNVEVDIKHYLESCLPSCLSYLTHTFEEIASTITSKHTAQNNTLTVYKEFTFNLTGNVSNVSTCPNEQPNSIFLFDIRESLVFFEGIKRPKVVINDILNYGCNRSWFSNFTGDVDRLSIDQFHFNEEGEQEVYSILNITGNIHESIIAGSNLSYMDQNILELLNCTFFTVTTSMVEYLLIMGIRVNDNMSISMLHSRVCCTLNIGIMIHYACFIIDDIKYWTTSEPYQTNSSISQISFDVQHFDIQCEDEHNITHVSFLHPSIFLPWKVREAIDIFFEKQVNNASRFKVYLGIKFWKAQN
ncbi:hypothetical protein GJ496_008110 [Pomphorhynchus laevis]|nr:hypothetical protein GJ496_008110 [Pomphorhynchus laevis]